MSYDEVIPLVRLIADGDPPAPSTSAPTVTLALIGLAGLVLSAMITGYFGTRGERPRRVAAPAGDEASLRRQLDEAVHAEAIADDELRDAVEKIELQRARLDVYERALVLRGFAPWRFITGEETDAHARIDAAR